MVVLSTGQTVDLPPHDEFYEQLTSRNRGLISDDEQLRIRRATILVAGCGSVGGAAIEPLIRLGAEQLVLAEPDVYDLPNMNRQSARLQDLGRNKAEVFRERMRDVNPYASVQVVPDGVTLENAASLVRPATVILDGIDVTTRPPLRAKFALHREGKASRVPVISGYDIAGLQLLFVYDYRRLSTPVLNGRIRAEEVERMEPLDFLGRVIPRLAIPHEIIPELRRQIRGETSGFPQLVYTAQLFGVLASRAVIEIVSGRTVRERLMVDVTAALRPLPTRLRVSVTRLRDLFLLNREFERTRRRNRIAP